jgi:hypothetical protein
MFSALWDLIGGGWKECRSSQGYSYQVHRSGKRRVVPIEGWRVRGVADEEWVLTGKWSDENHSQRYRDYTLSSAKKPTARGDHPRFRRPDAIRNAS